MIEMMAFGQKISTLNKLSAASLMLKKIRSLVMSDSLWDQTRDKLYTAQHTESRYLTMTEISYLTT